MQRAQATDRGELLAAQEIRIASIIQVRNDIEPGFHEFVAAPHNRLRRGGLLKFVGTEQQVRDFIVGLIKEYNYRRNNLIISLDQ